MRILIAFLILIIPSVIIGITNNTIGTTVLYFDKDKLDTNLEYIDINMYKNFKHITIIGCADTTENSKYKEERADKVKDYLLQQGIEIEKIQTNCNTTISLPASWTKRKVVIINRWLSDKE